jgi:hypothetical protein
MKSRNGYWEKTIYGKRWKTYRDVEREETLLIIVGLVAVILFLLFG